MKQENISSSKTSTADRTDQARHVTWTGFVVNLVLLTFKLAAGLLGNSAAMIADALHSISDFTTDIIVLASFRVVDKPADKCHDYGHGKYESVATIMTGLILVLVGIGIFWSGSKKIFMCMMGHTLESPGLIALSAALISIVAKEWLYQYTKNVGNKINSQAVTANAWHHRSDAFSSIGTAIGIGGAIFLGQKWRVLDPVTAVIVSLFILKVAMDICTASIKDLTDGSLDEEIEKEIESIASETDGSFNPHNLRTRRIGNNYAIDLHIRVDANLTVKEAHTIASTIEAKLRARFGADTFVSIHTEPRF